MPSRKEIHWAQLKVGALVLAAVAVLIGLIFLMTGSSGGLFTRKLILRSYFANASNLKSGAPVTLEGVTIGNVTHIHIVPARNPTPVEVTMQVSAKAAYDIRTDSTTSIAQAGVLGDSYIDIDSKHASGPTPPDNAELQARNVPSIQAVVDTSQDALQQATTVMRKISTLMDSLNSRKGTAGLLLNDPELYHKLTQTASNLETVTRTMTQGKGTLGKLMTDETLYTKLNTTIDQLSSIANNLDAGKGSAGKLLRDEALYNNLNAAVANTNKLLDGINQGKGSLGKLASDPVFAKKLDNTVTNLDTILQNVQDGKGTIGQLMQNRSLYDHSDQTMDQAQQLVKSIRENPKKYLVIHLKIF